MDNAPKDRIFLSKSFLKFLMLGAINTPIGIAIMFILYNVARLDYWPSSIISYCVTGTISFFLNKYFTFKVKKWSFYIVASFICNLAACYFIAYFLAKRLIHFLLMNYRQSIRDNVALLIGAVFFTVLNYLGQRYFVYKTKESES
jgi:putative flippase GtrA